MTVDQVTKIAVALGIKPTKAPIGSEIWQCWADRVRQAEYALWDYKQGAVANPRLRDTARSAITEANRYAI
jgi:hypothetical protein